MAFWGDLAGGLSAGVDAYNKSDDRMWQRAQIQAKLDEQKYKADQRNRVVNMLNDPDFAKATGPDVFRLAAKAGVDPRNLGDITKVMTGQGVQQNIMNHILQQARDPSDPAKQQAAIETWRRVKAPGSYSQDERMEQIDAQNQGRLDAARVRAQSAGGAGRPVTATAQFSAAASAYRQAYGIYHKKWTTADGQGIRPDDPNYQMYIRDTNNLKALYQAVQNARVGRGGSEHSMAPAGRPQGGAPQIKPDAQGMATIGGRRYKLLPDGRWQDVESGRTGTFGAPR